MMMHHDVIASLCQERESPFDNLNEAHSMPL